MSTTSVVLVHISTRSDWEAVRELEHIHPRSLGEAGFVHLSSSDQVHLPANRLFTGRKDLVLLVLDPDRLAAPLRWEAGVPTDPESMLFPHLYGPLPTAAVVDVVDYVSGDDGTFAPPVLPPTIPGSQT